MSASLFGVLLVVICAAIEGFAQLLFKKSALAAAGGWRFVVLGMGLFAVESLIYTGALRFLDLSTAYPLGALSFVAVTLLSQLILKEKVGASRWIGVGLILLGAGLVVVHG